MLTRATVLTHYLFCQKVSCCQTKSDLFCSKKRSANQHSSECWLAERLATTVNLWSLGNTQMNENWPKVKLYIVPVTLKLRSIHHLCFTSAWARCSAHFREDSTLNLSKKFPGVRVRPGSLVCLVCGLQPRNEPLRLRKKSISKFELMTERKLDSLITYGD